MRLLFKLGIFLLICFYFRWLGQMGVGYLVPKGTSIADSKKFTHLCSTLMDKIEQRHGAKLKPLVSHI